MFILIVVSCNLKSKQKAFIIADFIEAHKTKLVTEEDLIFKLDSVLEYNEYLTENEKGDLYFEKGKTYAKLFNYKKAVDNYTEAEKLFKTTKNTEYIIRSLINLSNANTYLKNNVDAYNQAFEALDVANNNNYSKLTATANNVLARIYYFNKDFEKSFEYLNNSVELQIKEKDSIMLSASYNNMAILYKKINNFEEAITYNYKSLALSVAIKDSVGIGKTFSNLGELYRVKNNSEKALFYFRKAIENNRKAKIINSIPFGNIGSLFFDEKKLDSASFYLLKSIKIEELKNNSDRLLKAYNDLSNIYKAQNKPIEILKTVIKIDSLKAVKSKQENLENLKTLNNQQKLFLKEKQIAQIKRISTRNTIIFIAAFTILGLLGIILFQKGNNQKLKYKEEKNSLELKVLRAQMNPHFIFNALSAIQNSILDNDPLKSATYLSRFAKLIRQNFDFINHKTIPLKDELDALKNYLDTQIMRFENKFDYTINLSKNINITNVEIPPLLLQPFIENAIEHGFKAKKEKGLITINISKKEAIIYFEIIDNGIGFTKTSNHKKTHSTDVFKKRLKLLGNKDEKTFTINSSKKGTTVKFSLKQ